MGKLNVTIDLAAIEQVKELIAVKNTEKIAVLRDMWKLLEGIMRMHDDTIWYDEITTAHEQLKEIAISHGAQDLAEEWQRIMEGQTA